MMRSFTRLGLLVACMASIRCEPPAKNNDKRRFSTPSTTLTPTKVITPPIVTPSPNAMPKNNTPQTPDEINALSKAVQTQRGNRGQESNLDRPMVDAKGRHGPKHPNRTGRREIGVRSQILTVEMREAEHARWGNRGQESNLDS